MIAAAEIIHSLLDFLMASSSSLNGMAAVALFLG
jgi:hypothetical protein